MLQDTMVPTFGPLHAPYIWSALFLLLYLWTAAHLLKFSMDVTTFVKMPLSFHCCYRSSSQVLDALCIPPLVELTVLLWLSPLTTFCLSWHPQDMRNVWPIAGAHKEFLNKWLNEVRDGMSKSNKPRESNIHSLLVRACCRCGGKYIADNRLKKSALFL